MIRGASSIWPSNTTSAASSASSTEAEYEPTIRFSSRQTSHEVDRDLVAAVRLGEQQDRRAGSRRLDRVADGAVADGGDDGAIRAAAVGQLAADGVDVLGGRVDGALRAELLGERAARRQRDRPR